MSEFRNVDDIVIVKVGTNVLTNTFEDGHQELDSESFRRIGRSILALESIGVRVVLVTSAGITAGMAEVGLNKRPDKTTESGLLELQRLSSIGWRALLNEWHDALSGRVSGSLQLTTNELDLATPREEALGTIQTLLRHDETPIVNENDAITRTEITFGDNDILAATLASRMVGSSTLSSANIRVVLLSDVHGVYEDKDDPSTRIHTINDYQDYLHLANDINGGSGNSKGGMTSKFNAAKIVTGSGMSMYIAHGRTENILQDVLSRENRTTGTEFLPKAA